MQCCGFFRRHWLIISILAVLICGVALRKIEDIRSDVQATAHLIDVSSGEVKIITLPYSARNDKRYNMAKYVIKLAPQNFLQRLTGSSTLQIIPDDCVRSASIDNIKIDLKHIRSDALCNYREGFSLDLSAHLDKAKHELVFVVENTGGPYGFNIQRPRGMLGALGGILCFIAAVVTLCLIFKKMDIDTQEEESVSKKQ